MAGLGCGRPTSSSRFPGSLRPQIDHFQLFVQPGVLIAVCWGLCGLGSSILS